LLEVMPVVAAAGNSGRREVTYPAGYDGVIGVTAVDANRRRWPRANTGAHVAIAAPGAQVWSLGADGAGYYADGTSIAAVFVSAALAIRKQTAASEWLRLHTQDAGPSGKDPEFGHGLLAMHGQCPGDAS
jgi:subtilisin family serine protease